MAAVFSVQWFSGAHDTRARTLGTSGARCLREGPSVGVVPGPGCRLDSVIPRARSSARILPTVGKRDDLSITGAMEMEDPMEDRPMPGNSLAATPVGTGCLECLSDDGPGCWLYLRPRGHIGYCDSSPSQHASAHTYRLPGHPPPLIPVPGQRRGHRFSRPPSSSTSAGPGIARHEPWALPPRWGVRKEGFGPSWNRQSATSRQLASSPISDFLFRRFTGGIRWRCRRQSYSMPLSWASRCLAMASMAWFQRAVRACRLSGSNMLLNTFSTASYAASLARSCAAGL
ncbi:hypothetical protein QFZ33_003200 [Arthrobacter globiformis]|nr:hypothetical protein [Arthrobacter globiformis]